MQTEMTTRRVVRRISVRSATRVAFAFTLTLGAVGLVGLLALYALALASGAIRPVERFLALFSLSDAQSFRLSVRSLLFGVGAVSAVACLVVSVTAAVFATLYNALADLVGGVEVVTRER